MSIVVGLSLLAVTYGGIAVLLANAQRIEMWWIALHRRRLRRRGEL